MVKILLDTSVLIGLLEEGSQSAALLQAVEELIPDREHLYSSISRLELSFGEHHAISSIGKLLLAMRPVPLDDAVAQRAGRLLSQSFRRRRRQIPDAVIAASALQEDAWLWTLNEKDFRGIEGLRLFSRTLPQPLRR